MLTAGCTGSNSEQNAPQNMETSSQAAEETSQNQTSSLQSADDEFQDTQWDLYTQNSLRTIMGHISDNADALESEDFTSLAMGGQKMVDDTQNMLDENKQYTVSPKYQAAQKEWILALEDFNSHGKYLVIFANDAKNGSIETENLDKQSSFLESASAHISKIDEILED